MPPAVTVLTAVRNGARFLPEMMASIRNQTFTDWEHVIVDDGSDDGSARIVESAMDQDSRVRLVRRTESGGPYVAANEGLEHAQGRYVVRIDADDVALPVRIESQLAYLGRTGLRACASYWSRQTETGASIPGVVSVDEGPRALKWRLCLRQGLAHSSACIEHALLQELGGYAALPVAADLRMWCELARRDALGVVPEVLVVLRRPGSLTSARAELQEGLALETLTNHLNALSRDAWAPDELRALRPGPSEFPIAARIHSLKRWAQLWQADPTLSPDDRRALSRLGRRVRWAFTRQAIRRDGVSLRTLRGILATTTN